MTNIIEEADIINKFLCQIKRSLPLGIRLNKNELNDILDEIEEHIWEKAIESAGDKEPNEIDVQIAISQMGDPLDIASKFTSRSTPYVYISEELYPYYKNYRKLLLWASILSIFLYAIYQQITGFYYDNYSLVLLFSNIGTILIIYFTFFIILARVLYYLSNKGYIPYRLRKYKMQNQDTNNTYVKELKFQQSFKKIGLCLEIFLLLLSSIVLNVGQFYYLFLLILAIVKGLRGFIKKKSIIWQKSLILVDILFTVLFFQALFNPYYYLRFNIFYFRYNELFDEIIYVSSILCLLFYIYILYEVYLFITIKEKLEFYLKEVSLNKRINKREIILESVNKDYKPKEQDIPLENKTLSNNGSKFDSEFEKTINNYLKTAKKKLPNWLKKSEKHEVIRTIEEEIRESTIEIEKTNILKQETIIQNINNLGILRIVLSDYITQGTPKLYISKEL